jgi:hypothetical protein
MAPEEMLLLVCTNLCRKGYRSPKRMIAVRELIRAHAGLDWDKHGVG